MGFYGHITNVQRTTMTFDKIYSNRFTMDQSAKTDGVYAGRYVLIEYDRPIDKSFLERVIQFDGILYAPPPVRNTYEEDNADPSSPLSYLVKLEPYIVKNEGDTAEEGKQYIEQNLIVVCSQEDNLGVIYTEDDQRVETVSRLQYFRTGTANNAEKESYNLLYNYKERKFQLDSTSSKNAKVGCSYTEVNYSDVTLVDDSSYLLNFNMDASNYTTSRGYDSTVWQKTYVNGEAKYVMIAELNSVVPIMDVTADAPTLAPVMPHFDKDSTNIYYKLHMQPSWGFRIKAADPLLHVPTLDYSGSVITDSTGTRIPATSTTEAYPSDQKVQWTNTIYKDNNYTNNYLNTDGYWQEKPAEIPGAIYFNKAGFDKKESVHSKDWTGRALPVSDEITLTPTGFSGHLYPTHTTDGKNIHQPDVNELAVLLPSIGDTVADMWDIIYGNKDINGGKKRNTVIRWEDAKDVLAKEGLRLVRENDVNLGYTYNEDEVNTLAGVINSVQDIMGMIITDDYPAEVDTLNENYIYYDTTSGKYYYKRRTYTYTPADMDTDLEPVDLIDWESKKDSAWWVDTNSSTPDYIQEDTYRPDRSYVEGVNVPTDSMLARHFSSTVYKPGEFFIFKNTVTGSSEPLRDPATKAEYHKYVKTQESYDVNNIYYDIEEHEVSLSPDAIYYVPNKYYEGHFFPLDPPIVDEEDFEKRLAEGVRIFKTGLTSPTYGLSQGEEVKSGQYNEIKDLTATLKYLTLKTCSMSEAAYNDAVSKNAAPMLFSASSFGEGSGIPTNYYVISEKYELMNDKADWEQTVKSAPGVYYYLQKDDANDQNSKYINTDTGILRTTYLPRLQLEYDVLINDNCLYFRKIVELILSSAENVVNIQGAKLISVESLPSGLYRRFNDGYEEGYYSVSALSDIIVNATNYGEIDGLCTLTITPLEIGYTPNKYYYVIPDGELVNSLVIDNRLEPTVGRDYYPPEVVNKRTMTAAEIQAGRKPGVDYYIKSGDIYELYSGALVVGNTYYISSLTKMADVYYPNKYYYQNENGEFVLDMSPTITPGREYFKNPQLYVYNDPNNMYSQGAAWPLGTMPPADSGIELARREDAWELAELKGFDITFNTLHGLILRLNQMMMQGDTLTRDENTLQGMMNKFNDLVNRFGSMCPGQFMMVDNAGRMHGVTYSTKQDFSAVNHGGQNVVIESTEADANGEDRWIDVDSDDDFKGPSLTIKHNFTKVKDTTSKSDMNNPEVGTVELYTPIVDAKGHVVGKNLEEVTLPYGFKNVTFANVGSEALSQETVAATSPAVAEKTQDTLNFKAGNKWIEFATSGKDITIFHRARNEMPTSVSTTVMDNASVEDNRNTTGQFLADVGFDAAGHLTSKTYIKYTLPNGYQKFVDNASGMSVAENTHDTFTFKGDSWLTPTVAQGNLTYTHNKANPTTNTLDTIIMDDLSLDKQNVLGPIISNFAWDETGHITKKELISYRLPNAYQSFYTGAGQTSTAQTTHDSLTIVGDKWVNVVASQGRLTFTHKNEHMTEGFSPAATHSLGEQTPAFGATFNLQTITLDANGHIVGKGTETVTLPVDIAPLMLKEYEAIEDGYLETDIGLTVALHRLDTEAVNCRKDILSIEENLGDKTQADEERFEGIENQINEVQESANDGLSALQEEVNEYFVGVENQINEVQENANDGLIALQDTINEISNFVDTTVCKEDKFIYTPEIPAQTHEATQEDVDNGLATEVGEIIEDAPAVPAEELTIQELFNKVKALELLLNNPAT